MRSSADPVVVGSIRRSATVTICAPEATSARSYTSNPQQLAAYAQAVFANTDAVIGSLTDSDLDQIAGQSEKLIGVIQERYGYARDRAEQEVRNFQAEMDREKSTTATKH